MVHLQRFDPNVILLNKRKLRVILTRLNFSSNNTNHNRFVLRELSVILNPIQRHHITQTVTDSETEEPILRNVRRSLQYIYPPGGILLPLTKKRLFGYSENAVMGETPIERQRRLQRENKYRLNEARAEARINQRPLAYRGSQNVLRHHLGAMSYRCNHCRALHFQFEKLQNTDDFSNCCERGKVSLQPIEIHPYIMDLCCNINNPNFNDYHKNIRRYNCALSFASFGFDHNATRRDGFYNFAIQGRAYHFISSVYPQNVNTIRQFGQLYVIDTETATQERQVIYQNLNRNLLIRLDEIIREINPFAQIYRQVNTYVEENDNNLSFKLVIYSNRQRQHENNEDDIHPGRQNLPTVNEVAGLYRINDDGLPVGEQDIIVYSTRQHNDNYNLRIIPNLSPNVDPLSYVLLFPYGDLGWQPNSPHVGPRRTATRNRITLREYGQFRLAIRNNFEILHSSTRVFQQYVIDLQIRIETIRLQYVRHNQNNFRSQSYAGLQDYLEHVNNGEQIEDINNSRIGRSIILPSSFTGSPRFMTNLYQNAMAVVRTLGKPDLFVTFTCNPDWPEIQSNIEDYHKVHFRHDILVRVFRGKLKEFMNDILEKDLFGKVTFYNYTIEFQKRGLPHAHIILGLHEKHKIKTEDQIDSIISAEIPDAEEDPELFETVTKYLMHGPCGTINPNAICMQNGKCSKKFPKDFSERTVLNPNNYPIYQRRNNNRTCQKVVNRNIIDLDNKWVVPYCPYIAKKYNNHTNVESVYSVQAVKYIYKYILKGRDMANVEITTTDVPQSGNNGFDEITHYETMRYLNATESLWHIFNYPMHDESHSVVQLSVHLPQQQNIVFREGEEQAAAERDMRNTTLTGWFQLNQQYEDARIHLYQDIPIYYVWNTTNRVWTTRQRSHDTIGRVVTVNPRNQELYALRLLLLRIPGATSFEYLKTVNNTEYGTFQLAAVALNLIESDEELRRTIAEASTYQMPKQLRQLFATCLVFNQPKNALIVWNEFRPCFLEDFVYNGHTENRSINMALKDISDYLFANNMTLEQFGLPPYVPHIVENFDRNEVSENVLITNEILERRISQLNNRQRAIFDEIMSSINDNGNNENRHKLFFVDAPGGTGKTFLLTTIIYAIVLAGKSYKAVAWTGIAASLLPKGTTVHSTFQLPIPLLPDSSSMMDPNSDRANDLKQISAIIWDECSMIEKIAFSIIDRLMKDICNNGNVPFGGKVIILSGDFRQIPPVVPNGSMEQIISRCVITHNLWSLFRRCKLEDNMRLDPGQQEFSNYLLSVGNGSTNFRKLRDYIRLPNNLLFNNIGLTKEETVRNLIKWCFGNNILMTKDIETKIILCPINETCEFINNIIIDEMIGQDHHHHQIIQEKIYLSTYSIQSDEGNVINRYPVEYLNTLKISGLPFHALKLKLGSIVMLLRNINIKIGLVNGIRLKVNKLNENSVECMVLTGRLKGTSVLIPRIDMIPSDSGHEFQFKRRQFPLTLAFAITINKSQGQTFSRVGVYLSKPVFNHGQLYVALSRATNAQNIKVIIAHDKLLFAPEIEQNENEQFKITQNLIFRQLVANAQ